MSDSEQWLAALRADDEAAWARLFERYRPFVLGRLRQAAASRNWFWLDDLDDAAQEVLVRFYEAAREGRFEYRDEPQLRGFLVRTAFYVAMRRKDSAHGERPASDVWEQGDGPAELDLGAFADSAFDTLGREDCFRELYRAIERLQPARREVLGYTLMGLKPRQIAPKMDRSANAISVLKFHALEDLRAELEATDFMQNCGQYFLREE